MDVRLTVFSFLCLPPSLPLYNQVKGGNSFTVYLTKVGQNVRLRDERSYLLPLYTEALSRMSLYRLGKSSSVT